MTTPILVEDYLRMDMLKANRPHTDDKLNKFIYYFAQINKHKHLDNMESEEKDTVPKMVQSQRHKTQTR